MATKNTSSAETTENEVLEDAKVPHQSEPAKVTSIKKAQEPVFDDEIDGDLTLVEKTKRLAKNKRVLAGAITTAVLAGAVLVIRKRNSAVEETDETPEA